MASRDTTTYHTYKYHQNVYHKIPSFPEQIGYSVQVPSIELKFYDRRTGLVGLVSSETYEQLLEEITFEHVATGCGGVNFSLGKAPTSFAIRPGMRVDIHMFRDVKPWYSGILLRTPTFGSTDLRVQCEGHGFYDYLDNIFCKTSGAKPTQFLNTEVTSIVVSILQNFIVQAAPVEFNPGKIEVTSYVAAKVDLEMATAKQALEDLAALAQDFEIGIDESRELFFRRITTTPTMNFFYGKHLEGLEVTEDYSKLSNRLYVKHAFTDPSSKTVHNVLTVEDVDSQRLYGIREAQMTAPSVVNTADALRWANYQLTQTKRPLRSARLANVEVSTKLVVRGSSRVFGYLDSRNYSDEFDDSVVSRAWTTEKNLPPANEGYDGTVVETGGSLLLYAQSWGATRGSLYHNIFVYKELTGDFIVETKANSYSVPGGATNPTSWASHGIHIRDNRNNWLTVGKTQLGSIQAGNNPRYLSRWDTSSQVTNTIDNSWETAGEVYFKVQRTGSAFRAWSGTDGANWTEFSNPSSPFLSDRPVQVGLLNADGNAFLFNPTKFEYFRITNLATVLTLPNRRVQYKWSGKSGRSATIEVGDYDQSIDAEFVGFQRKIKTQELLSEKI